METFICVEKLREKYENPALMRGPHFPLVLFYPSIFSTIQYTLLVPKCLEDIDLTFANFYVLCRT